MNVKPCLVGNGQHYWVKIEHEAEYEGMQCYSCPMCNRLVYWSSILEKWVDCTKKKKREEIMTKHNLDHEWLDEILHDTFIYGVGAQSDDIKHSEKAYLNLQKHAIEEAKQAILTELKKAEKRSKARGKLVMLEEFMCELSYPENTHDKLRKMVISWTKEAESELLKMEGE